MRFDVARKILEDYGYGIVKIQHLEEAYLAAVYNELVDHYKEAYSHYDSAFLKMVAFQGPDNERYAIPVIDDRFSTPSEEMRKGIHVFEFGIKSWLDFLSDASVRVNFDDFGSGHNFSGEFPFKASEIDMQVIFSDDVAYSEAVARLAKQEADEAAKYARYQTLTLDEWGFEVCRDELDIESSTSKFFVFPVDPSNTNELRCMKVVGNSAYRTDGVFTFCRTPEATGSPYSEIMLQVSEDEFARIERGETKLPDGWDLSKAVDLIPLVSAKE